MTDYILGYRHQEGDASTDPEYVLTAYGEETGITIQDCRSYGGGWSVNDHGGEGSGFWMKQIKTCGSLAEAKRIAAQHYYTKV